MARKPKNIQVQGRRWRDGFGNTYHTITVFVDGRALDCASAPVYGYGDHYLQTAVGCLKDHGYLPGIEKNESLWRYCQRYDICFCSEAVDVVRKKDL